MVDDDSGALEREMVTFFRLHPRLHNPNASTDISVQRAEYALLRLLDTTGPFPLGHAARALELDASTVTWHARLLTERDLVRGAAADDRRVKILDLTDTGRRAVREVTADRINVLAGYT